MTPFCDWVNVTVPWEESATCMDAVWPVVAELGAECVGQVPGTQLGTWKVPSGSFKASRRGAIMVLHASGGLLMQLRAHGLFNDYLRAIAESRHRVTMLHATLDMPDDAPAVVSSVYDRALSGQISLSRKAVRAKQVKRYGGPGHDGRETGTVYLGNRANADVWAKVYDKRQERLDKGMPDPGPMVRYEVAVASGANPSLRDVAEPAPVFYHYASPDLVDRPPDVPAWVPGGSGFALPPRLNRTPAQRLERLVQEHGAFDQAARLCAEIGEGGLKLLARHMLLKVAQLGGTAGPQ
jgi:hypothetical protein